MKPRLDIIYCKSEGMATREVGEELIIIPVRSDFNDMGNEIYALDEIGQEIWKRIDGKKSVAKIIDELAPLYDTTLKVIKKDVQKLIAEISKRQIINKVAPE